MLLKCYVCSKTLKTLSNVKNKKISYRKQIARQHSSGSNDGEHTNADHKHFLVHKAPPVGSGGVLDL